MSNRSVFFSTALLALLILGPAAVPAQDSAPTKKGHMHGGHGRHGHAGHDMGATGGAFGPYPMSRETSGTSWQPDLAPHSGAPFQLGGWNGMVHGFVTAVYTDQGGHLGDDDFFSTNMVGMMAQRPAPGGRLSARAMLSFEPATMGKDGYPLLLQTGETADGVNPLIDRQHPHDLLMELSLAYSFDYADDGSIFFYGGLPGEPAVGPPTFMHRFSGMENPEAPISHHWLDSTHITFGVFTAGITKGPFKLDASIFNAREPDEERWNFETGDLDSWAVRGTWNPLPTLSLQGSFAALKTPEQLHPGSDTDRITVSAIHHRKLPASLGGGDWQTTFSWGRNMNKAGSSSDPLLVRAERDLDAFLLESAAVLFERHTAFGRLERVKNDELFRLESPLHGLPFTVGKFSLGYLYDFFEHGYFVGGVGAVGSVALLEGDLLKSAYGDAPVSGTFFFRLKLG